MTHKDENPICLTITIVGAVPPVVDVGAPISVLMQRIEQALAEAFPDFIPGHPPVTIQWSDLRDDWIKPVFREAARGLQASASPVNGTSVVISAEALRAVLHAAGLKEGTDGI